MGKINKDKFYKKCIEISLLILILIIVNLVNNIKTQAPLRISLINDEKIYILPEENSEIYKLIDKAKQNIDITIYMLSDKEIKNKLIEKQKNGINVRIIIEQSPFGGGSVNYKTKSELTSYGINIKYANPNFSLTHAKYIIIDKKEALIMTANLTHSGLYDDRDFAVYEDEKEMIDELNNLFEKDFSYKKYYTSNNNLIISPNNSRLKIESLINASTKNIKMYAENIDDKAIVDILINKIKNGIAVNIIVPDSKKIESNTEMINKLHDNGAIITYLKKPYQHAKVLIIDDKIAYIGSINFSRQSMEENREVGIITINTNIINKVINTFEKDSKIR